MSLVLNCVFATNKKNIFWYINNTYQFQKTLAHPDFQCHQDIEPNGLQEENPQPKDAPCQKVGPGIYTEKKINICKKIVLYPQNPQLLIIRYM